MEEHNDFIKKIFKNTDSKLLKTSEFVYLPIQDQLWIENGKMPNYISRPFTLKKIEEAFTRKKIVKVYTKMYIVANNKKEEFDVETPFATIKQIFGKKVVPTLINDYTVEVAGEYNLDNVKEKIRNNDY